MTDERPCPFCKPPGDRIAFEEPLVFGLWDAFPATPGHLLLIPRRHIPTWFEATAEEQAALGKAIDKARALIEERYRPDGFNIGVNVGQAAGQTVFHLHVHVIPRYLGDVPDPTGGIRHVIPEKANYHDTGLPATTLGQKGRLVKGGEEDPLLPSLTEHLAEAHYADLAVGFILPSGLDRLEIHLADLLDRGGRLRIVTGDYLDITDPDALTRLLDLKDNREIRIFQTRRDPGPTLPAPLPPLTFHPKAYLMRRADGTGVAFVGSSNLSGPALTTGLEWNYRVVSSREGGAFEDVLRGFEQLFAHRATRPLDEDWIAAYRRRRRPPIKRDREADPPEVEPEPATPVTPHSVQQEALAALEATRQKGYEAGLVVLATGLGKTWLSAFDSNRPEYPRVLFVAHREEILTQARNTFRRIRPQARLGFYAGSDRAPDADVLFASIQTLGRAAHLERFGRTTFDYIVVDEFHHASAKTYRRLIDYFQPRFLLGLTATPERTDASHVLLRTASTTGTTSAT